MTEESTIQNGNSLESAILRFNIKMFGFTLGILMGLAIFIATNWLLIKGGTINASGEYVVGPHLQILGQFFIGYKVSFLGSIIGFAYGFAAGTLIGGMIGWTYNKISNFRN